jgi:hypothetical protein
VSDECVKFSVSELKIQGAKAIRQPADCPPEPRNSAPKPFGFAQGPEPVEGLSNSPFNTPLKVNAPVPPASRKQPWKKVLNAPYSESETDDKAEFNL